MRLVTRYNQYTIPVMIIVFILSGIVSFFFIEKILMEELDEGLLKEKDHIQQYINQYHRLPSVMLFNSDEMKFEPATNVLVTPHFTTVSAFQSPARTYTLRRFLYTVNVGKKKYLVTLSNELEGTKHMTMLVFMTTLLTIFILIVTTLLINALLMTKLWRPFYQVMNEVKDFKINQQHQPEFPETQIDEFRFMISCLNTATSNAAENYRILKEFTENASHEIQTPLAIIRSKLDLLVQHEGLTLQESASLRSAYGAIKKLSLINRNLLLITKIENRQFDQKIQIDLCAFMESKIIEFQELWSMEQFNLVTDLHPATLMISKELLDILINNVLSNATKHNRAGGKLVINLIPGCLTVANTGVNYPLDEKLIFKRFYKADTNNDNNGLGLAIVQQICNISDIAVTYDYAGGLHTFSFLW